MDIKQYTERLANMVNEAATEAREGIYIRNGNMLLANIKNRIQREGKDSIGAKMSDYSNKPAYYKRDSFVKKGAFKGVGKNGGKKFKNGNSHKSMYLNNGYKEFREIQGRQTQIKDLTLSGDLMLSYVLGTAENAILLGFNQTLQSKKRKGLEKQNGGQIFKATDAEIGDFNENVVKQQNEIINKAFQ